LNNVFNGEGTYIDESGEETVTMYENGRAVGESKVIDKENVKPIPEESKNETKKPEEKKEEPKTSEPTVAKIPCPACNGKGKVLQPEVKRNRSVVKDISNGLGPRNFVTYTVSEVVKPAAWATCKVCHGSGIKQ